MKIIKVNSVSDFKAYDEKVTQGKWKYLKGDQIITKEDHLQKNYQRSISSLKKRIAKGTAAAFSLLILMPLWSKKPRHLWKEATTGIEKVKVIAHKDEELTQVAKLTKHCVNQLMNKQLTSLTIFIDMEVDSKIIRKQFLFTKDADTPFDKADIADIEKRIEKYILESFLEGKRLSPASKYRYDVMGIGRMEENIYAVRSKISKENSGSARKRNEGDGSILQGAFAVKAAVSWVKDHLPGVEKIQKDGKFLRIDGIYQPL